MEYTQRPAGYLNIRDAALKYEVSRSKLHRLVRSGQLHGLADPRDGRATLLSSAELESLFSIPRETDLNADAETLVTAKGATGSGYLTPEARARIDALRLRATEGMRLSTDSADIVREAQEISGGRMKGGVLEFSISVGEVAYRYVVAVLVDSGRVHTIEFGCEEANYGKHRPAVYEFFRKYAGAN